jgi:hypothetical protein
LAGTEIQTPPNKSVGEFRARAKTARCVRIQHHGNRSEVAGRSLNQAENSPRVGSSAGCRTISMIRSLVDVLVLMRNPLVHLAEKVLLIEPFTFWGARTTSCNGLDNPIFSWSDWPIRSTYGDTGLYALRTHCFYFLQRG